MLDIKGVMYMSLTISSFANNSFSSLFGTSSSTSSAFGGLETSLTSYAQLRNGSYGKLIKSYYSKYDSDGNLKSKSDASDTTSKSELGQIKTDSADVSKAADKLLSSNSKLWEKIETTDDDGNTSIDYDRDAVYNAVKSFADKYNSLIDSGQKSESTPILTQVAGMVTSTAKTSQTLAKAGISIDSSNHLVVDEDFLKNKADITYVKDLFSGIGSYAYQIASKASMINSYASADLSNITGLKSYTSSGSYSSPSIDDMISSFDTRS